MEEPDGDREHIPSTCRSTVSYGKPERQIASWFATNPRYPEGEMMKIRSLLALVGLAITVALPALAQQQDTVDPKIAEQVRALATKYDEAFNQNDAAAIAALITDDAVWMTPHGTLSGRQAVQNYCADYSFRLYHCNNVSTKCDQVNKFGNDVDAIGTWSCTFEDGFGHTNT
jgi:uncharacterized protein (TIGR02246 family)